LQNEKIIEMIAIKMKEKYLKMKCMHNPLNVHAFSVLFCQLHRGGGKRYTMLT